MTDYRLLHAHLHLLQHTAEAGCLACSRGSRDVEAAGNVLKRFVLQEGPDGRPLGLSGHKALRDGSVERLLHTLKPQLWRRNGDNVV